MASCRRQRLVCLSGARFGPSGLSISGRSPLRSLGPLSNAPIWREPPGGVQGHF